VALPDPKPGLIVRYDYLWSHEAAAGRDQGKDRPACLVAASDSLTKPRYVVLLPITHSPPGVDTIGIEIPAKAKQALGLDELPSWIIVSEYNVDEWPKFPNTTLTNGRTLAYRPCPEGRACSAMASSRRACSRRSRPSFSNWRDRTRVAPCGADPNSKRMTNRRQSRIRPAAKPTQKSRAQAQMQGSNPAQHP
jgi:hypothetical protein